VGLPLQEMMVTYVCCMLSTGNPSPSLYNDVFGFFMGPAAGTLTNIAVLPGTSTPVTISTINAVHASQLYRDNSFGGPTPLATEFDGITKMLKTADVNVTSGTTYRIKLSIADGDDSGYDSAVYVKLGSLRFGIKDCVGSWVASTCNGVFV
jgi:large repetitive protein